MAQAQESFTSRGIVADTQRGLLDDPKWLSSLYFYDERGSQLFEEICATPEYYVTRTEEAILREHAAAMVAAAGAGPETPLVVGELGSGSSAKTRVLLQALLDAQGPTTYLPVDVSPTILEETARDLEAAYAGLTVQPLAAEYKDGLDQLGAAPGRKLILFLGSSLGNFEPNEQLDLLAEAAEVLSPGDAFLLGTDLVKPQAVLEAAYDDAAGVTAAFNKNILAHLNREMDGDADPDAFDHEARWNARRSRIEMHLVSRRDQHLRFPAAGLEVHVEAGESIHTENSYKFTVDGVRAMAARAGFTLEQTWTDEQGWFALHLLRV
ncbi:MAG: L-histidine N(alpha)-methyltransferase [Thermoplasmatota archaeon]